MRAKQCCNLITEDSRVNIWHPINAFQTKVASTAVCSKAMVLLLLIHCL